MSQSVQSQHTRAMPSPLHSANETWSNVIAALLWSDLCPDDIIGGSHEICDVIRALGFAPCVVCVHFGTWWFSLDYMLCYFSSYKWRKVLIRIQLFVHMKILKAKSYVNRVGMPWKVGHGWKVQQEFVTLLGKITHDSIPDLYCLSLITVSALVVWFHIILLHGSHKTAHKAFIWNIN